MNFNSRSLRGEWRTTAFIGFIEFLFQFMLPAWRETVSGADTFTSLMVSIHIPRLGSDYPLWSFLSLPWISIHVPRMESDVRLAKLRPFGMPDFNSRSLRGERYLCVYDTLAHAGISILIPRMGSDGENGDLESIWWISILASCMENDWYSFLMP